jgi:hypothetical protein
MAVVRGKGLVSVAFSLSAVLRSKELLSLGEGFSIFFFASDSEAADRLLFSVRSFM